MTKRGCAMTCRRRAGCLLRVHHPPRRHPRPRTPTLFPLSRECMRPKLYMSTVESPSFAFVFVAVCAHCEQESVSQLQCKGDRMIMSHGNRA